MLEHENFTTFRQAVDAGDKSKHEFDQAKMDLDTDSPPIKFILKNSVFVEDEGQLRLESKSHSGDPPPTTPDVVQLSGRGNQSKSDINLEKDNLISRLMELETEDLSADRSKSKNKGSKKDQKSKEKN